MEGFDPRYDEVKFTFKASCPSDLDCKTPRVCPPPQRTQPEINFLAKDYTSFRQLILDRLALIMPDWKETHVPDLGITLVELLAYVGDYLSYYQDAVATEAYLGTARQRISVRRHVKLVDYAMHEGCNARAWITIATDTDEPFDPKQIYFITAYAGVPARRILTPADLEQVPPSSYEVFEPLWPANEIEIYKAHSEIHFYTWGDCQCCLAKGATSATLIDAWVAGDGDAAKSRALNLKAGDVLIFEEVIGLKTGNAADADPTHRQAVRLTQVTTATDPLYHDQPLVEIEWAREDALTFPLCLSVQAPPPKCDCLENVSVARGNVVLVDHGARVVEQIGIVPTDTAAQTCGTPCKPAEITITAGKFQPVLDQRPLTFSQPIAAGSAASALVVQDPRQALPDISLTAIPPAPGFAATIPPLFTFDDVANPAGLAKRLKAAADVASQFLAAQLSQATRQALAAWDGTSPLPASLSASLVTDLTALFETWLPLSDLLESGPNDAAFVVEMDDAGYGHLRFGDGSLGQLPDAGTEFEATYRYGNGPSGNVGAETILYLVLRQENLSGVTLAPRNPLAATGGTAPEPVADVKMFAPFAFRDVLERAITADDYATLAANPALQGAKATLRWTGSWYEALVAVDPLGTEQASAKLLHTVKKQLEPFRRVGHDLMVSQAQYVPLDLALTICVLPNYQRAHVEAALLGVLGAQGFFAPDNLTFGEGIYVSRIVAAAQAVAGVQNVVVNRLERYEIGEPSAGESDDEVPAGSVLALGPLEIARLDNDPNFPENGRLTLDMRGGR